MRAGTPETKSTRGARRCSEFSDGTTAESTAASCLRQVARPDLRPPAGAPDRVHGATGVIPTPLWIVLFSIAIVIFVYMLFFADSGERAVDAGLLIGSVVLVMVVMLLLLQFLDDPYRPGIR